MAKAHSWANICLPVLPEKVSIGEICCFNTGCVSPFASSQLCGPIIRGHYAEI